MSDYYKTGFEQDVLGILNDIRKTLKEAVEIQKNHGPRFVNNFTGGNVTVGRNRLMRQQQGAPRNG